MKRTIPVVPVAPVAPVAAVAPAAPAVPVAAAEAFFANYTRITPRLPAPVWVAARVAVLAAVLGLGALLVWQPALGLALWWGLAVPALPALLVVAPGLWRQVCPMATLNQLPRTLGRSRARDLPDGLKRWSFAIAVGLFVAAVALRQPLLDHAGAVVAAGLGAALLLALAGGWWFKGRSGWCGTFCPLGPIQRTYGQAPLVRVRNGYCEPCVGCQKNCYDFNPRAAVFSDIEDEDPRHAAQRRLFMGLLPGLVLGYFAPAALGVQGDGPRLALLGAGCALSAGVYALLAAFLPLQAYRLSLAFGAAAIAVFYAFAGPVVLGTLGRLLDFVPADAALDGARAIGAVLALALIASGLYAERRWRAVGGGRPMVPAPAPAVRERPAGPAGSDASDDQPKTQFGGGRSLKDRLREHASAEVTDRETGITFQAIPDGTLLEAIERAGLKINYGCRAGVCGADAVAVCEGAEHLSPPGADESATLRRLGLEGRARLACMCSVSGPVQIDRDPHSAPAPAAAADAAAAPAVDRALAAGVQRVVVVGNGIAGMSAAEALRRGSASVDITLVTNEAHAFYNRMGIGRLVYDHEGMASLQLVPDDWATRQRVTLHAGAVAARLDRSGRRVGLAGGSWLPYDKLILATGARATVPAPDFLDHPNAFVLRSADDAQAIREYVRAQGARRAVVVGGGVLGVEAADALHKLGLRVTLLQRAERLMNAQLDERGAAVLSNYLESIGIQVVTGVSVARWEGAPALTTAWLAHGPRVRAEVFVACLGIQPNTHLAAQAGLEAGQGVRVDSRMRTADPHVFAVGDCADLPQAPRGLWPIAAAQAAAAVEALWGDDAAAGFGASAPVVQLKCDGIDVRSLGRVEPADGDEVFEAAADAPAWWRLIMRDERLVGGVFVGPPGSSKAFMRLLNDPAAIAPLRARLRAGELGAPGG